MSTVKNNQAHVIMPNLTYLFIVLLRAAMLGLIVFYSTSTIPTTPIKLNNKIIISMIVVVLYAVLDYFAGFFGTVRNLLCQATCGCSASGAGYSLDVSDANDTLPSLTAPIDPVTNIDTSDIAAEVDEAIRMLDSKSASEAETAETAETSEASSEVEDVEETIKRILAQSSLGEEEVGARKATGLGGEEEEENAPQPAESAEGFVNYGSF
jgi:hypothetical protein